jgi:hypothetical protein
MPPEEIEAVCYPISVSREDIDSVITLFESVYEAVTDRFPSETPDEAERYATIITAMLIR